MKHLLLAGLVVVLSYSAHAGGNPDVRAYIDFDPPNYVHEIDPEPYTTVEAYLCLDNVGDGVTAVSFRLEQPDEACAGVLVGHSYQYFFPNGVILWPPWPSGVTVPSTECMTEDPLIVCMVSSFYLGGSCCIEILDHLDYPRWVVDCGDPGDIDHYCVLVSGSIGGAECPDGDCGQVPVEPTTWSSMKALYR